MQATVLTWLQAIVLLVVTSGARAQVPNIQEEALIRSVSEQLKLREEIKFTRITREGKLSACEMEFETSYRDRRASQGRPVVVMGAISSVYSDGKYPSLILKIKTHVMDLHGTTPWRPVQPTFADAIIGTTSLKPYRVANFACEGGGLCQGYVDTKMTTYKAILNMQPLDIELRLSLVKGGMDQSIKLADIGNVKIARGVLEDFQTCTFEVLSHSLKQ